MEPGGREGIDLQGVEGDRLKHAIEIHGNQRVEDLPQPVIMERAALEPGLEEGYRPTVRQAGPHVREGMMAIKTRQEQGRDSTATREDRRRVRRRAGLHAG